QEKITVRAKIHAPLEKEGPHCDRCHAEKEGMLDFAALGASADQEQAIRRHVIPRFFGHYPLKANEREDDERIHILDLLR
ncbi:MAG: hypothetical protein PHE55_12400, partial [Methylococcaceae bacterium]|nr:hypothetical protein [Methylococcaceae bacterium]